MPYQSFKKEFSKEFSSPITYNHNNAKSFVYFAIYQHERKAIYIRAWYGPFECAQIQPKEKEK